MKKNLFLLPVFMVASLFASSQSIHSFSIRSIDGDTVLLNNYAGKKLMFLLIPLSEQDSVFQQITQFRNRYLDTVVIIGVPSMEDGYQASQAAALKSLYAGTGLVLTEGMYTKKASSANQSEIMQWLTDKNKNLHFNKDASGVGSKFFLSETGRLFAVLPRQASLLAPIIDRIVHSSQGL